MSLSISVKNCCHSTNHLPRFDAKIGDKVLIRKDERFYEAVIDSIPSATHVTVIYSHEPTQKVTEVASGIEALFVGD